MKLGDLETGSVVYIDTNIWYMYLRSDPAYLGSLRKIIIPKADEVG